MTDKGPCPFPGCPNRIVTDGLCPAHYQQRRLGKELAPLTKWKGQPPPEATLCADGVSFTFTVASRRHGDHAVTAPLRFRGEIEKHRWSIQSAPDNRDGKSFYVETVAGIEGTGQRRHGKERRHRHILIHRFIWELAGNAPVAKVDHADRDPLNNSEDNLRDGTIGNTWNQGLPKTNTSGVKGVYWHKKNQRWVVRVSARGITYPLGCYATIEEARNARNEGVRRFHGEFGVLS